ncbi:bile acid:sodium symporter family protein [Psychrobacillus sp. FJAT-51614]|uniref:Bile acid:sodium symporter family protein n=1 Tax=Psychrobacillus mangrovi TaxID=3117745 RepID=A0ABU8EZ77_9BACI
MLESLNMRLQTLMPVLTPLSLIVGVLLGDVGGQLLFLVPWLFAFMTFAGSLSLNFKGLKSFTKYPFVILMTIAFLHIIMPIWAYIVATVLFEDHLLTIGFILSVAVPTGVTSFIWVAVCRGNLALCLSIILIDTLLSPIIMPFLLHLVIGKTIEIDTVSLMFDLLWMIVLPSILGMLLNELTKGNIVETIGKKLAPFSKMSLFFIVLINGSVVAPFIKNISWEFVSIIVVVFVLALSGYAMCFLFGHFLWKDVGIVTTFVFTGGMRNISMGVVVASAYFPPKVAIPVVFGMLFQQVLASLFSRVIEKYKTKLSQVST